MREAYICVSIVAGSAQGHHWSTCVATRVDMFSTPCDQRRTRMVQPSYTAGVPSDSIVNSGSSINAVHVFPWVIPAFQSLLCYLLPSSYSQSSPPQFRGARGASVGPIVSTHKPCLYVITDLFLLQTTDLCANVPWDTHMSALLTDIMTETLEYSIMATVKLSLCMLFLFL